MEASSYVSKLSKLSNDCSSVVWWSSAHTYKNAITNQLFLLTSASGYLRTGQSAFLNNANLVSRDTLPVSQLDEQLEISRFGTGVCIWVLFLLLSTYS